MQQIRLERLILRSGRERLYEIEMVETTRTVPERYLVNYRYGWSGGALQEGTRTESPVDEATAARLFDSLVQSRRNQGYVEAGDPAPWDAEPAGPVPIPAADDPRAARLLYLIRHIDGMDDAAAAKLVWRIGQVRLAAAAPDLAALRHGADRVTARVLPYALLRCGAGHPATVLPALETLAEHEDRAVATPARLALSDLGEPERERTRLMAGLPGEVARAVEAGGEDGARQVLGFLQVAAEAARSPGQNLPDDGAMQRTALLDLFILSRHDPQVRPLLLAVLSDIPFAPFLFRAIRTIHKAAEAMDDAAVFGVLADRIHLTRANYGSRAYRSTFVEGRRRWLSIDEEMRKEDARLAWSGRTRAYFRRRVWRHLRRMGEEADPAYTALATELLLRVDDDTPREQSGGYPPHPHRYAENWILHGAGHRIEPVADSLLWRWSDRREATGREERFSQLWDAAPDALLRLLLDGRARIVRGFAARALAANAAFAATLPLSDIVALLRSPHDEAHDYGLALARRRLTESGTPDDAPLIPILLRTARPEAVALARMTMNLKPELVTASPPVAAGVILAAPEDAADWLDSFWTQHAPEAALDGVVADLCAQARGEAWPPEALDADKARMRRAAALTTRHFAPQVKAISAEDLLALSRAPAVPPKLLAVLLAAARPDGIATFDPRALAGEDDPDLQAAGATLLAEADIDALAANEDLILAFLRAPSPRSREAALYAAERLATHDPAQAARRLALGVTEILYRGETHEGVRDDAVRASRLPPLREALLREGPDRIWSLLRARAEPARRVGSELLDAIPHDAYTLRRLARIGLNDQVKARRWAVDALEARLPEVQATPEDIFALLDGDWPDSREAAYALIRENLDPAAWRPETVVALCDCVTPPAQQFGREILGRAFADEHAPLFLRRLSEHPAPGFRLTIARFIREYAGGDPVRLREVEPALRTILSRVFSSRAAKTQATAFIEEEIARGDPDSLRLLGDLLGRISATGAIGDRARILDLIVRLKEADPALVPEARIIEPEIRHAEGTARWK